MAAYGSPAPGDALNYGQGALSTAMGETGGAAGGLASYNPFSTNNIGADIAGGNAYSAGANIPGQVQAAMQSAEETARDVTLPGMASAANPTGNANNSRGALAQGIVQRGLAEQAGNLSSELAANYYNTGAGLTSNANTANNATALSALGTEGQLGAANGGLGTGALSSSLADQNQVFQTQNQGGVGLQAGNQAGLTNQLQGYNFGQSSPFQALQNYWNIIGSGSWGGTSNTNSTTTYTPSMFSTIGGLMGGIGSLFGQSPGANGGGSGILGLMASL